MNENDHLLDELRRRLVGGAAVQNRRRAKQRHALAAAPAVATVALAGLFGRTMIGTDSASAATFVVAAEPTGKVRVDIYPNFNDVASLKQELRNAGISAKIIYLRGHPAVVGTAEVVSHGNQGTPAMVFDGGSFVLDPALLKDDLEILVYGPAREGETYQFAPSIFSPDEALGGLSCAYPDRPLSVDELESVARKVGISEFDWVYQTGHGPQTRFEDRSVRPVGNVVSAQLAAKDRLRVFVADDDRPAKKVISMSSGTHFKPNATCTQELADRWP